MTTIYLATARGLCVITGSEGDWRGAVRLENSQVQCVTTDLNQNGVVYCGTQGDGMFKSEDGGATWNACRGLTSPIVTALTASKAGEIYAGTEPSAVFRSVDRGETWHELSSLLALPSTKDWSFPPRPETHHVQSILPDLANPGRLHVAIEAGALLRTDDGGRIWRDRVSSGPTDTHSLAVSQYEPTRLHSAAGDGYFESLDDGDTWRRVVDGLKHGYCWSVAVSNRDPATLLLSASKNAYAAHFKEVAASFVYRRTGSEPWRQVQDGLPEAKGMRIPVIVATDVEPGVFYLSADGAVYQSFDAGEQWQELVIQWSGKPGTEHAVNMTVVEESTATNTGGKK